MPRTRDDSIHKIRRITDRICVLVFAIGLTLPLVGFILDWHPVVPPMPPTLREGKPQPALNPPRSFSQRFERYFDRHLGFRERMVRWNNAVTVLWLNTDPTTRIRNQEDEEEVAAWLNPGSVKMGSDGWMFYLEQFSAKSFRGLDPMKSRELQLWRLHFENRRTQFAARGIDYVLVIVPEKQSVLLDLLPSILKGPVGPSRTDQIMELLARQTAVDLLDLRERMRDLAAESHYPVYHRTGTHWNELGAFLAYRELLIHLQKSYPALEPWPLERFDVRYRWGESRGLPAILRIHDLVEDEYVDLVPIVPRVARDAGSEGRRFFATRFPKQGNWTNGYARRRTGRKNLPRAVFLHDSFLANYMEPFLSEHFEEVTYHWRSDLPLEKVAAEAPDIVIELRVSSMFDSMIPSADGSLEARLKD